MNRIPDMDQLTAGWARLPLSRVHQSTGRRRSNTAEGCARTDPAGALRRHPLPPRWSPNADRARAGDPTRHQAQGNPSPWDPQVPVSSAHAFGLGHLKGGHSASRSVARGRSTPAWNAAALRALEGELPSSFPDATKSCGGCRSLSGVLIVLGGWGRATEDFSNG